MEKAIIRAIEGPKVEVKCMFNPTEYTFRKTNSWTPNKTKGANIPAIQFSGGDSARLSMQLFLDTSTDGGDVRDVVKEIRKLMAINPSLTKPRMGGAKGRPPMVEFLWGRVWTFKAVVTSLTEKFTLFRDNGVPVRATLDLEFLQAGELTENPPPQNPTTGNGPGYKQWVVREGDTIDWIAFSEYGDAAEWRYVAETNSLDDPDHLRQGQILAIAPPR